MTNTLFDKLRAWEETQDLFTNNAVSELKCQTCTRSDIGQTGISLKARLSEHNSYIRTNNPKSAYVLHILNRHEYGTMQDTTTLIKSFGKGSRLKSWENFYIQISQQK
jgi:hypothetical protein